MSDSIDSRPWSTRPLSGDWGGVCGGVGVYTTHTCGGPCARFVLLEGGAGGGGGARGGGVFLLVASAVCNTGVLVGVVWLRGCEDML